MPLAVEKFGRIGDNKMHRYGAMNGATARSVHGSGRAVHADRDSRKGITMAKKWIFGGLLIGGIVAAVMRRRRSSGYEYDEIDSAEPGTFGERGALSPEQKMSTAKTEHGVTPEELSTAAKVENSFGGLQKKWPSLTLAEIQPAEGDLDKVAGIIAAKSGQPQDQVRKELDGIIAEETPTPSFPGQ